MNGKVALILIISFVYASYALSSNVDQWVSSDCSLNVAVNNDESFEITNEKVLKCEKASIFWNYPISNMTVRFRANREQSQPFNLCIDTEVSNLLREIPLYHITPFGEIKLNIKNNPICLKSDYTSTVVLRSIGPQSIQYYGQFIHYNIEKL